MTSYFKKRQSTYRYFIRQGRANVDSQLIDAKSYKDFLNSAFWKNLKLKFFKTHARRCFICGEKNNIQIHHIRYTRMFMKASVSELLCLCDACHEAIHKIPFPLRIKRKHYKQIKNLFWAQNKQWEKVYSVLNIARFKIRGLVKKSNRNFKKNYAGIFTWKAEELRKQNV